MLLKRRKDIWLIKIVNRILWKGLKVIKSWDMVKEIKNCVGSDDGMVVTDGFVWDV